MNNLIEQLKNLQSSLRSKEESERQTGRSTKIINQAKHQGSTLVCANYRQKEEFKNLGVESITLEQYHKEKHGSSKTYLFDHYAIYCVIDNHYSQLIKEYEEQMSEKETIRVSFTFDIDVGSDLDQELEFLHSKGKYSRIKRLVEEYIREKIKDPVSNPDFLKDMKVDFSIHSRTREQIIDSMCLTYRHDYWLIKESKNFLSGMTEEERKSLYNQMAKIFDNDIAPYVDLKCFSKKNESSLSVDQLQNLTKTSHPPEGFSADTEW